jgi:hypothetical protein
MGNIRMNLRSYAVPACSFLLAVALSLVIAPAPRLSARAVRSTTGSPTCETYLEILGKDSYLPRGDEKGDEKKMGNSFVARIKWEPVGGHDDGTKRRFLIRLEGPPALKGCCDNKGKEALPDYTLEAGDNPLWKIEDGVPDYAGVQDKAAVTREKYGPGEWVSIVVRSYDFGAWTRVVGSAEGCPEKKDRMPKDTDEETLPDLWEQGKRFYDDAGNTLEYNIGAKATYAGEDDASSDRDGGFNPVPPAHLRPLVEAAKVHDEPGDGYTAFEEYRGVFVQGKFYRMNELVNDGGPEVSTSDRGTKMKNVFVHDPDDLIVDRNPVLPQLGVQFHRIKQDEMSEETADGELAAGYVDFDSVAKSQRAILIVEKVIPEYGFSNGFTINQDLKPVLVNMDRIESDADDIRYAVRYMPTLPPPQLVRTAKLNRDDLRDFTVAHEIGHKLSLKHNESTLTFGESPDRYDNTVYWNSPTPYSIKTWTLVELYERKSDAQRFEQIVYRNILEGLPGDAGGTAAGSDLRFDLLFEAHDRQHLPATRLFNLLSPALGAVPFLPHKGTLMDAKPEFNYLRKPLPADQRKTIKLK